MRQAGCGCLLSYSHATLQRTRCRASPTPWLHRAACAARPRVCARPCTPSGTYRAPTTRPRPRSRLAPARAGPRGTWRSPRSRSRRSRRSRRCVASCSAPAGHESVRVTASQRATFEKSTYQSFTTRPEHHAPRALHSRPGDCACLLAPALPVLGPLCDPRAPKQCVHLLSQRRTAPGTLAALQPLGHLRLISRVSGGRGAARTRARALQQRHG
jgi:hypothetical protein